MSRLSLLWLTLGRAGPRVVFDGCISVSIGLATILSGLWSEQAS